ncbi:hypothetical protein AB4144_51325, partial [Rhizobiaceae sp. 2RAB30]
MSGAGAISPTASFPNAALGAAWVRLRLWSTGADASASVGAASCFAAGAGADAGFAGAACSAATCLLSSSRSLFT